ncbi:helix-turn-helix domain-containing protein [Streptomyces sp. TS71-3]|uniref:nSTAND1 domain-containing NTPase n=1 Tax=Streptomyces sp. TS71-3 TaxID=2733862 RepID=UPI002016FE01|nr:helix-turn-helix domain-containing protein [Streptomyces sp. TS71-3]
MEDFAFQLRELRQSAGGVTYRQMARRAEFSAATLAQAAAGRRLPTLAVALAYARACGGAHDEWERRWQQAAAQDLSRSPDGESDEASPYLGLRRFEPQDQDRFFGREQLTADLAGLLRARRCVALVGASGSGKSSLLRAGLIPALRDGSPESLRPAVVRVLTPGPDPVHTHAAALSGVRPAIGEDRGLGSGGKVPCGGADTVVVVDQFEELFTLCRDPHERTTFIDMLLTAQDEANRLRVVIAVRADFFGHCANHRNLADALRDATLLVGPMTPAELRAAIVKPAATAGLVVERALSSRIIEEVTGQPGALPMMSHTLLQTWRRRRGRALTASAYEAAGGLRGAIAQSAEEFYNQLSPDQVSTLRRMMLRMITPGEGTQDTRRPVDRTELSAHLPGPEQEILERLARLRLVTLDETTVELAHEALISAWSRLHGWIEEERSRLRVHRALTDHARAWEQLHRDAGALYRGTRLETARKAFQEGADTCLTTEERTFLNASITAHEKEQETAARTTRRLRSFATSLCILLALTLVAAGLAFVQRHDAIAAQDRALSRQLAAQSATLRETDPDLAALLAVHAYQTSPTTEATVSLYAAAANPLRRRLRDHGSWVAYTPDGNTLVTASPYFTVNVRNSTTGGLVRTIPNQEFISDLAVSPDGRTLALNRRLGVEIRELSTGKLLTHLDIPHSVAAQVLYTPDSRPLAVIGSGQVVDLTTGRNTTRLRGLNVDVRTAALSHDGRTLATVGDTGPVCLWDLATGHRTKTLGGTGSKTSLSVDFSPDDRTIATADIDNTVRLWNTATGRVKASLTGHTGKVTQTAFSPDGSTLASAGDDSSVRLWDTANGRSYQVIRTRGIGTLAFSPDGHTLATGGSPDDNARLWNVDTPIRKTYPLEHGEHVTGTALSPDKHTLAVSSVSTKEGGIADYSLRLLDTDSPANATLANGDTVMALAFSPDGRHLAGSDSSYETHLWDARTTEARTLLQRSPDPYGRRMGFSADGQTFAAAATSDSISLWKTFTDEGPVSSLRSAFGSIQSLAVGPDGRTIAALHADGGLRLWNTHPPVEIRLLTEDGTAAGSVLPSRSPEATTLAFSPNGRFLAVQERTGTVQVWDTTTGDRKMSLSFRVPAFYSVSPSMVFSPDNHTLAVTTASDVQVMDTTTGYVRATLPVRAKSSTSLVFSTDGHTLITTEGDGNLLLWNVALPSPASIIVETCLAVDRTLSFEEEAQYLPRNLHRRACSP